MTKKPRCKSGYASETLALIIIKKLQVYAFIMIKKNIKLSIFTYP